MFGRGAGAAAAVRIMARIRMLHPVHYGANCPRIASAIFSDAAQPSLAPFVSKEKLNDKAPRSTLRSLLWPFLGGHPVRSADLHAGPFVRPLKIRQ